MTLFLNKIPVSTPRLLMFKHTPENGSPLVNVTRRISPGRGASGLSFAKSRVREP
ncbi:MAG: hypothetical protein Q9211_006488, partial [Gyalolechia sp. 1 TL-2023]